MAGKFKYEDGYVFNSGVQLIKRNYKKEKNGNVVLNVQDVVIYLKLHCIM